MPSSFRLILASTSPFRKKILIDAGYKFDVLAPLGDEKSISGLPPKVLAGDRAKFKALDVAARVPPGTIVIGADQVLGFNERSIDKVDTEEAAVQKLTELQGKTHFLHSAYCLVLVGVSGDLQVIAETVVDIPMTMRPLDSQSIHQYVSSGEWKGSVGCYRIEGLGKNLFIAIGGTMDAIIGLPMTELEHDLSPFDIK